jgi:uncharacterized protein YndB with AHSA1/START domain
MKTIHHVIDISAPSARLWWALTDPAGLTAWWSARLGAGPPAVGAELHWRFEEGFNPIMEITRLEPERELGWRCTGGHEPWLDNTFTFQLAALGGGRTKLRFWQEYALELPDDAYGTYNFNWGYYLESFHQLCVGGSPKPHRGE